MRYKYLTSEILTICYRFENGKMCFDLKILKEKRPDLYNRIFIGEKNERTKALKLISVRPGIMYSYTFPNIPEQG